MGHGERFLFFESAKIKIIFSCSIKKTWRQLSWRQEVNEMFLNRPNDYYCLASSSPFM